MKNDHCWTKVLFNFLGVTTLLVSPVVANAQTGVITDAIVAKAKAIVSKMTLEEKVDYIGGRRRFLYSRHSASRPASSENGGWPARHEKQRAEHALSLRHLVCGFVEQSACTSRGKRIRNRLPQLWHWVPSWPGREHLSRPNERPQFRVFWGRSISCQ